MEEGAGSHRCAAADEHGLPTPLNGHGGALGDIAQVHLHRRQRQHVLGGLLLQRTLPSAAAGGGPLQGPSQYVQYEYYCTRLSPPRPPLVLACADELRCESGGGWKRSGMRRASARTDMDMRNLSTVTRMADA